MKEKPPRKSQFSRVYQYLWDRPAGGTVQEMADALGVSPRTVYRHLADATAFQIPIEQRGAVYFLRNSDREGRNRTALLSQTQIRLLSQLLSDKLPHSPELREALAIIQRAQNPSVQKFFEDTPFFYIAHQDGLIDGLLDSLVQAIKRWRVLEVTYGNAAGTEEQFRFCPYAIIQRREHFYLVGRRHGEEQGPIIKLRLDSIRHAPVTRTTFPAPAFDVKTYASRDFGPFSADGPAAHVRLQVAPAKAHAVARTKRHPSQVCEFQPDGSLIYTLTVPLSPDLVWWVAGYGGQIRVLEPPELRNQVLEHGRKLVAAHE